MNDERINGDQNFENTDYTPVKPVSFESGENKTDNNANYNGDTLQNADDICPPEKNVGSNATDEGCSAVHPNEKNGSDTPAGEDRSYAAAHHFYGTNESTVNTSPDASFVDTTNTENIGNTENATGETGYSNQDSFTSYGDNNYTSPATQGEYGSYTEGYSGNQPAGENGAYGYANGTAQNEASQNAAPQNGFGGYYYGAPANQPQSGYGGYTYAPGYNSSYPSPVKKKRKMSAGLRVFTIILAAVVVAIGCFSAGYIVRENFNPSSTPNAPSYNNRNNSDSSNTSSGSGDPGSTSSFSINRNNGSNDGDYSYADVAKIASASVVNITVYSSDGSAGAYASGVIMSEDGYVLTNDHIYSSISSPQLLVTLHDNTEYKADFVAGDTRSDLSIIKLRDASGLKAATFGSSSALSVGDEVMAIGQSDGLSGTVTTGIVSCMDRRVSYTAEKYSMKLIQTTAAINPGSSGGALVNMRGEVVGITSSKVVNDEVEGICFAIPSDYAVSIVKNMQQNGTVRGRSKLGITYSSIGTVAAEVNGLPKGVYIQSISQDSGLYGKDIAVGDVITGADGQTISSGDDLLDIMENHSAGDTINFTVYKASSGETVSVSAELSEYIGKTAYSTAPTSQSPSTNDSSSEEDFLLPNPNRNNNNNNNR